MIKTHISAVLGTGQWERGRYAFRVWQVTDQIRVPDKEIYLSGFTHKTPEEAVEQGVTWCDNHGYDNPSFVAHI